MAILVLGCLLATLSSAVGPASAQPAPEPPAAFLQFDGASSYVEIPDSPDFSVATTGALTVSAWLRPDTLTLPNTEGSGYVYWLGKGTPDNQEWVLRMYSQDNSENRANRISFYVFNPRGGLGIGSYVQEPVTPGQWIQIVGVADQSRTSIYKNGVFKRCDQYTGADDSGCQHYAQDLWVTPSHGTAPVRMGTRDLHSFFAGALSEVRVWNRVLSDAEIADLYAQDQPSRDGLVAEYLLNEGGGSVAHDTAGGHDAAVNGATWSPPA